MTAFTDFVNLELPKRGAVLLSSELGFAGDPNTAVDAALNNAPQGRTYFWDSTNAKLWHKRGPTSTDWVDVTAIGGGGSPALEVATHADLKTITPGSLTAGDEYTVLSDGTKWTYTGTEPAAPDPSVEAAWNMTGPALESWFADPLFPIADSRTVYLDAATGSDVFNDGTSAQPFAHLNRALAAIPETNGRIIFGPGGFPVAYTVECQGAGKLNLENITAKFASATPFAIDVLGARNPVDLDGAGTTEFASAVFNRDLTGPLGSGGTVAKNSQYRLGIGVNVLPGVQQPADDDVNWIFKESNFGFTGFRLMDAAPHIRVHDAGGVMGPQDIGVAGGAFNFGISLGDVTTVVTPYVTKADGATSSFYPWSFTGLSSAISIRFIGIDFATDLIANNKFVAPFDGNVSFLACKFKVGGTQNALTIRPRKNVSFGATPLRGCVIRGEGLFNNSDFALIRADFLADDAVLSSNVLLNAALVLANGSFQAYMNVYRGSPPPQGNNGFAARLIIGSTTMSTERGLVTRCKAARVSGDFERAPGEAGPMQVAPTENQVAAAITAIGTGTSFTIGGSQGNSSFDIAGRAYMGVLSAEFIAQNAWVGEVTRPMLLRTGARAHDNQFNGNVIPALTSLVNVTGNKLVAGGGDVQLGLLPVGSVQTDIVKDWADLPANDLPHGDEAEGVFWR